MKESDVAASGAVVVATANLKPPGLWRKMMRVRRTSSLAASSSDGFEIASEGPTAATAAAATRSTARATARCAFA